jgi:hypothetical protein
MRHFEITEWADFVLATAVPAKRDEMAAHLRTGCDECARMRDLLQQVREMARSDAHYDPPANLTGMVLALAKRPLVRKETAFRRLIAKVVYDSFATLQPQGTRGGQPARRELGLAAGKYRLDLQMERSRSQVTLVGQFGWDHGVQDRVDGLPVLLLSGNNVIAQAVTNSFGEFCLEYPDRKRLRLCIPLDDISTQIEVPLSQLE